MRPGQTKEEHARKPTAAEKQQAANLAVELAVGEMLHDKPQCPYCKKHPCECTA